MKRALTRWPFFLLTLVGLLFILAAWSFGTPSQAPPLACFINPLIERVTGETPEAKVAAYLEATRQGDEIAAYNCWLPTTDPPSPEYEARRQAVMKTISALGSGLSFRVLNVEWWRTCCEPGVIDDPKNAGFTRLRVTVGGSAEDGISYVFDVLAIGGSHWGEMMGCPVRHWEIIDAYPESEEPLYWMWSRQGEWQGSPRHIIDSSFRGGKL